ncbi:MAG: aspartate carbamoyltransferase catalytic subunit [Clostridia bacterium]
MKYGKDMLGLKELSREQITHILDTAEKMKVLALSSNKRSSYIQGKTIVTLFYENSTRTRMSFELAAKYMGGNIASITASSSSTSKGEVLIDTGKTLDMMGTDVVIIRHPRSGAPALLGKNINASVINAGDGMNEHPTQALLDIFTMREKMGWVEGLKVAIVGDILHSRVARSNIYGLTTMGARVALAGPRTLIPPGIEKTGVEIHSFPQDAIRDADVVMGLRIQKERQGDAFFPTVDEYHQFFGINDSVMATSKKQMLVMHPGPVNRGIEMSSSVIDGSNSMINMQVLNGVAVRMALLYLLTRREI